jgi:hypothetical protein
MDKENKLYCMTCDSEITVCDGCGNDLRDDEEIFCVTNSGHFCTGCVNDTYLSKYTCATKDTP